MHGPKNCCMENPEPCSLFGKRCSLFPNRAASEKMLHGKSQTVHPFPKPCMVWKNAAWKNKNPAPFWQNRAWSEKRLHRKIQTLHAFEKTMQPFQNGVHGFQNPVQPFSKKLHRNAKTTRCYDNIKRGSGPRWSKRDSSPHRRPLSPVSQRAALRLCPRARSA